MKKTIKSYSSKVLAIVVVVTMLMSCMSFQASAAIIQDVIATDKIGNIDYAHYSAEDAEAHVMEFNPSTGLMPMGYVRYAGSSSTLKKQTEGAKQDGYDVYGMINGEFFSPETGNHGTLTGRMISNGRIISDHFGNDEFSFVIDKDGKFSFVQSQLAYHFYIEGKEVGSSIIHRINKRYNGDWGYDPFCYFDSSCGTKTDTVSSYKGVEVVFNKLNGTELVAEGILEGEVVSVNTDTYGTSFADNQFVLYAYANSAYATYLSNLKAGQKVQIYAEELNEDAKEIMKKANTTMAATYPLIIDGQDTANKPMNPCGELSFTEEAQRTAIGVKADGSYVYFVSSGRSHKGYGPGRGLTIPEVRTAMRELGCVNAVNLDGGGSSTLNFGGTNKYVTEDRPVGNVMMIVSRNDATTSPDAKAALNDWIYNATSELNKGTYTGEQEELVQTVVQNANAVYNDGNSMTGEFVRATMDIRSAMGVVPNVFPKEYISLDANDWSTNSVNMIPQNMPDGSLKLNSTTAGWPWATVTCNIEASPDARIFYDITVSNAASIILFSGSTQYKLNELIAPGSIDTAGAQPSYDILGNGQSFKGSIKISDLEAAGLTINSLQICSSAGSASNVIIRDFSVRTAYSAGDTDGDFWVNSNDARALLCHVTGKGATLSGDAFTAADANEDGVVDTADIRYILNMSVGLVPLYK